MAMHGNANPPECVLSIHLLSTPSQCTLSTHLLNTPTQHTLEIHTHTHSTQAYFILFLTESCSLFLFLFYFLCLFLFVVVTNSDWTVDVRAGPVPLPPTHSQQPKAGGRVAHHVLYVIAWSTGGLVVGSCSGMVVFIPDPESRVWGCREGSVGVMDISTPLKN